MYIFMRTYVCMYVCRLKPVDSVAFSPQRKTLSKFESKENFRFVFYIIYRCSKSNKSVCGCIYMYIQYIIFDELCIYFIERLIGALNRVVVR